MKKFLSVILIFCMMAVFMTSIPVEVSAKADIAVGDYIQMGIYYGKPILWRCVDIDENGPLILSDKVICKKTFDAYGYNLSGSHGRGEYWDDMDYYARQLNGSDYWQDSNLRCWLNSDATSGKVEWTCGNPPVENPVLDIHQIHDYTPYADEAGFLRNFTPSELNVIKPVNLKFIPEDYVNYEGKDDLNGNYYDFNQAFSITGNETPDIIKNYSYAVSGTVADEDRMFVLDIEQVYNIYKNKDILGTEYYLGYPTQECLDNHDNLGAYGSIYESTYYWTRTRNTNEPHNNMRFISPWGDVWSSSATGSYGIRPAFYLDVDNCTFKTGKGSLENPYLILNDGESVEFYYEMEAEALASNGTVVVYTTIDKKIYDKRLHIALYDDNDTMVDYIVIPGNKPYDSMNVAFKDDKNAAYAKIYLWESTSVIKPLSKAVKADIVR